MQRLQDSWKRCCYSYQHHLRAWRKSTQRWRGTSKVRGPAYGGSIAKESTSYSKVVSTKISDPPQRKFSCSNQNRVDQCHADTHASTSPIQEETIADNACTKSRQGGILFQNIVFCKPTQFLISTCAKLACKTTSIAQFASQTLAEFIRHVSCHPEIFHLLGSSRSGVARYGSSVFLPRIRFAPSNWLHAKGSSCSLQSVGRTSLAFCPERALFLVGKSRGRKEAVHVRVPISYIKLIHG